ncbi:hypothetical protein BGX20_005378 [Mortierella sp. AD010]|nr:hypothetical protein BGX20_005378 [Mortierella sp. AD010]
MPSFSQACNAPHPFQMQPGLQSPPMMRSNTNYIYHQSPVHPLQMETVSPSSLNNADAARFPLEIPNDPFPRQTNPMFAHDMDDVQASHPSYSPPSSSLDSASPTFEAPFVSPCAAMRSACRVHSVSMGLDENDISPLELPDEFAVYHHLTRHGSVDSLYPLIHHHEYAQSRFDMSTAMVPSLSSTSISSNSSHPPTPMLNNGTNAVVSVSKENGGQSKPKQRRASMSPDSTGRVFTCIFSDCCKQFKRSEHLKRHIRSVHTQEKPFTCYFPGCPKKFSRSDNLSQHVRIHRHDKERTGPRPFTTFTPFQRPQSISE